MIFNNLLFFPYLYTSLLINNDKMIIDGTVNEKILNKDESNMQYVEYKDKKLIIPSINIALLKECAAVNEYFKIRSEGVFFKFKIGLTVFLLRIKGIQYLDFLELKNVSIFKKSDFELIRIEDIILPKSTLYIIFSGLLSKFRLLKDDKNLLTKFLNISTFNSKNNTKQVYVYVLRKNFLTTNIHAGIETFEYLFGFLINMNKPDNDLLMIFESIINLFYKSILLQISNLDPNKETLEIYRDIFKFNKEAKIYILNKNSDLSIDLKNYRLLCFYIICLWSLVKNILNEFKKKELDLQK